MKDSEDRISSSRNEQVKNVSPLAEPASQKRSYSPPVLVTWGTLLDITQAVGSSGRRDGGRGKQPRRTRW
ncbi:hypothetical protein [Reyranella sp.]|uniref:hypothetical protein n=1 Tax=Reyranella sp. TaxID=1929291 RepID=UPI0011FB5901|nr:hypothetical protein [Reyranella sp.]TAJ89215.1 MAG: hypothetical protein EPO50_02260 [Reyranella sp.]